MKSVQSHDENVVSIFERTAEHNSDKTAVFYLGEKFTYEKLKKLIFKFATALHDLGVMENDKVLLYISNCPQWLVAYYAIQKIGATVVPISPISTPEELSCYLNNCGAETILCQDTNFGYVSKVFSNTQLKRIVVTNIAELLPWWKRFSGRLFDRIPHGSLRKGEGIYFFKKLIEKYPPKPPEFNINPTEHFSYLFYTAGSTGPPKGVLGTHATMLSYIEDISHTIRGNIAKGNEVLVLVNPLFQLMADIVVASFGLTLGNPTVILPQADVDATLEAVQKYNATLLFASPAFYRMMIENDRVAFYDFSSLRYFLSSDDFLSGTICERFEQLTSRALSQIYGCTETGIVSLSLMDSRPIHRHVGRPIPFREIRIVSDNLEPVSPGEIGELLVVSTGTVYMKNEEEMANAFLKIDQKTWFKTGDYVRTDENGELCYFDRKIDVIDQQGHKISASEIERVLQDHEAVSEACVVGIADSMGEKQIKAIVVNLRGVDSYELIKWCSDRLEPYKVPKYIEFRDMLPKSKVGKLLRRSVREKEQRRLSQGSKN